ncbi:MAG: pantoate--beta-alanine ligase [Candidatus Eisenbacteria bacterium]|uniref:Pantothenate synthetase n=1 Tax=Eiseniibacteriota bacterium TaxID=2212470 RepID=A0A538TAL4_UNCEI|nr:MAG: pantoate--beta-alanine ligase [Candidatus Eisenbacteria bacterium]
MRIVTRGADLRALSRRARQSGMSVGFVPTMGYLHEGHLALIRRARSEHHRIAVSVFVNPLQFGPKEDFGRYPRDEVRDVRLCRDAGCDWFFLPRVRALYPPGFSTTVAPGPLAALWEGVERPGHFRGVATIVLKLLNLVEPDMLYLGQKDIQQARIVQSMVRDLDLSTRVTICPTVRERDGLALSSRNVYLGPAERLRATGMIRAMREGRALARSGTHDARPILTRVRRTLRREARPDSVDYLALVDPVTLEPIPKLERGGGFLIGAIRIGKTRLIDNLFVRPPLRRAGGA